MKTKIALVIPCHLNSKRYPKKILLDIYGLPMIEHVRRRAYLSKKIKKIYIATCDDIIAKNLSKYDVSTIKTSRKHKNATTRVEEALKSINCSHVILLNGDEPLILPNYLDKLFDKIVEKPEVKAWNLTAPILNYKQFSDKSIVKCELDSYKNIISLYRDIGKEKLVNITKHRKVLGILAFRKEFLKKLVKLNQSKNEIKYSIEQFRLLDNHFTIKSVNVRKSLISINEKKDLELMKKDLIENKIQQKLLKRIIKL